MLLIKSQCPILDRRGGQRAFGQEFMHTHDPVGYIPSDLGSMPSSQISIPFIPSATGPFSQDLSQSSVINRKNYKQAMESQSQVSYSASSSTFSNHAFAWGGGMSSQNMYSSQSSIGLALSQSDRLRMMAEMATHNGPGNNINGNNHDSSMMASGLMSQDGFSFDDYKSQDVSVLSQDFDLRSQASQAYTQY
jgi:regulator of nonsense transcripts 1